MLLSQDFYSCVSVSLVEEEILKTAFGNRFWVIVERISSTKKREQNQGNQAEKEA
jgi:hypothetical protein